MVQGRGSAATTSRAPAIFMAVLVLLVHCQQSSAAVYTLSWTFGVVGWTAGKRFQAGDVINFRYSPAVHNVVSVPTAAAYSGCGTPAGSKVYRTGNDRITLKRGPNYFICSIPGHCSGGSMKINAVAA